MRHTTINASTTAATAKSMGNGNRKSFVTSSLSADETRKSSEKSINSKEVSKWTSADVQHWIKQQSKKFELKKATADKFEMNGPALALLTKHDFLRRSPDGGEVLYYALQRLINPYKTNPSRLDQGSVKQNGSSQHPRIVEIDDDQDSSRNPLDSSATQPIIEEPDDPPVIRRSQSETYEPRYEPTAPPHPFFVNHPHLRRSVLTMPAAFMYGQHPHLQFFHSHMIPHYHPMMSAQGVLIEIMDENEMSNAAASGSNINIQEQLFMVTMNGQQVIMNEAQVRQLVNGIYQQNLQQQQQQQQQQYQQQQQQYFQQQQQQFFQQQQQQQQQQQRPQRFSRQ